MDALKFTEKNCLQGVSIETKGKREHMVEILNRFQEPIIKKQIEISLQIEKIEIEIDNDVMSEMEEMNKLRKIITLRKVLKVLQSI